MRTTINLDDELVTELMHVSGVKRKREAIHLAISEFLRRKKIEGLLALEGRFTWTSIGVSSKNRN
ncbi:MAG: type II toxin-antitoxin system VapB family antitoxin [Candidatus Methylomirabilis sp.]|nr:type II toxin-antitoxin system VapB family antitoxin [Candidatus Methylomirabilis sp.]